MKMCINGATTMPYPLEQDIIQASQAGFEGIEIWWDKLQTYLATHSIDNLNKLFEENHIIPVGICPLLIWPFRDTEQARTSFTRAVQIAAQINCKLVTICPDFQPARMTREEALSIHAEELTRMALHAAENGIHLTIEPIGGHTLVPGPTQALKLIEMAGSPNNVGILMDTFHYFRSGVSDKELQTIPIDKLDIIHINDCEDGALNELTDAHRLYPTLGVIPAEKQLKVLKDKGYNGYFSVEIFRPEYWEQPIDKIMRSAYSNASKLIENII